MNRWWKRGAWLLAMLALGCTGSIGAGPDDPDPDPDPDPEPLDCTVLRPGKAPLRRLTVLEYDNTVRDLLGDTSRPASRLIDDERGVTSAEARIVTSLLAEQYMAAAEEIANTATTDLDALLACDRAVEGDDACVRQLIERLLPRAWRRPVSAGEIDALMALHTTLAAEQGYREGIRAVLEAVLQSPDFLYRVEVVPTEGEEVVRLDGYQIATRLSYLFWATMPDQPLYDAAAAGELDTAEGVATAARRLLADPQAEPAVQGFFAHYLELDHLDDITKDPAVFPTFNSEIAELMREETEAFVHQVMFSPEGDGSWQTLLAAPWSMMNAQLAEYYGVSGPTGEAFERVELDPAHHAGLLTQGSTLATRARTYESSPIHRGMFIRGQVMCDIVPDVPEGIEVTPPDPDPSLTTRERLAEHRAVEPCASCHKQIDPLGFAFEHFDGAGRFRPTENGLAIDASGFIVDFDLGEDEWDEVPFSGAVDMAQQLLASPETQACFSKRWFEYAYGRAEQSEDGCSMQTLNEAFRESGFDVRELLVALTQTDAFLYRVADQDPLYAEEGGE